MSSASEGIRRTDMGDIFMERRQRSKREKEHLRR